MVPRDGAIEVLSYLKTSGYRTGIISGCGPDVPALWNEIPFAPFFDVTVFSRSAGLGDNDLIYFPILCKTSHLRGYRNYKEERIITPRIRSLPVP